MTRRGGTYGRFMNVRVLTSGASTRHDHTLGIEIEDSGVHAEIALDEVHGSLGFMLKANWFRGRDEQPLFVFPVGSNEICLLRWMEERK